MQVAKNYFSAPNYFATATAAVKKMLELAGAAQIVDGRMIRGVIVRHLVLMNFSREAMKIVDWLYATFDGKIFISLMNQYTLLYKAFEQKKISRPLTTFEYQSVIEHAAELGITNYFVQVGKTADAKFIPNFNFDGVY